MSSEQFPSMPGGPLVNIIDLAEDYAFDNTFRIMRSTLQYRRFDGHMSEPVTRLTFDRGDSIGILLYDPSDDTVVLVRQFRYPVYVSLERETRERPDERQAWLLEIIAGVMDAGMKGLDVAKKELLEEAGYKLASDPQYITTIYPSPGGTSERIHIYLGEVDQRHRGSAGGGVVAEGEDTQVVIVRF